MSPQEIFDTVSRHLFAQGERAVTKSSAEFAACQYQTPDGKKCAVGCLIPDDVYTDDMEYNSVDDLVLQFSDIVPDWMCKNTELLGDLQSVHDDVENWESSSTMTMALIDVAAKHELNAGFLTQMRFPNEV